MSHRVTKGLLIVIRLTIVMVLLAATVAAGTEPASAMLGCPDDESDLRADATFRGSTGDVLAEECDRSPGSTGSSATPEGRWNRYCSTVGNYTEGDTVSVQQGDQVTSGSTFTYYSVSFSGHVGVPNNFEQITVPTGVQYFNYAITCTTPTNVTVLNVVLPDGANPISPIALRNQVKARITIADPVVAANPPLDDPDRFSVVHIPTWLWVEDPWASITESDSLGGISVSVTATPKKVTWDTGDGEPDTVCKKPGTPWTPGAAEGDTDCSHTYTRSSAGNSSDNAFELSATVLWSFTWELNDTPQGEFAIYQPVTSVRHQVGEIIAVNS